MKILFARRVWRNAVCLTCAPLLLLLISLMHAPRLVETGTTTGWRVAAIFVFIIYRWTAPVALPRSQTSVQTQPTIGVGMCLLNSELDGPADISDSRLPWKRRIAVVTPPANFTSADFHRARWRARALMRHKDTSSSKIYRLSSERVV